MHFSLHFQYAKDFSDTGTRCSVDEETMDSSSHAKPNHNSRNLSTEHNLLQFKNGMILPLLMVHNVLIENQSNTKFL